MIENTISHYINEAYKEELEKEGFVTKNFLTDEKVKLFVENKFKKFCSALDMDFSTINFDQLYKNQLIQCRIHFSLVMDPSIDLRKDKSTSWLNQEKFNWNNPDDLTSYRNRYLKFLEKIGRTKKVILETSNSSLNIISKVGNPKTNVPFLVKGMVVGSVQSGKTSNFNAVINSAVDIGYDLIIVFSGIMEDLRRQTQIRIEKEVVGTERFRGVFDIASYGNGGDYRGVNQIIIPTSDNSDFSKSLADANFQFSHQNILVCKKNTSILKNLILWLNEKKINYPNFNELSLLILDDECDNASLNNLGAKGAEFSSTINGHIKCLLELFNKKSYIGYTATPFANVLQDLNDPSETLWKIKDKEEIIELPMIGNLFPEDFIELLNPPSNYIGPKNYFSVNNENYDTDYQKLDLLTEVIEDTLTEFPDRVDRETIEPVKRYNNKFEFDEDEEALNFWESYRDYREATRATKREDNFPNKLPKSLQDAIMCYIITIAIRQLRSGLIKDTPFFQKHNSMLVHVSRFSIWQNKTSELIKEYLNYLELNIRENTLQQEDSIYHTFERIWTVYFFDIVNNIESYLPENYSDDYMYPVTYEQIRNYLPSAIKGIEVKAVNNITGEKLDYEGEAKKYLIVGGNRLSRGFTVEGLTINYFIRNTNYADALLQMGRWFGYRPGYLDCCKLFTSRDSLEKFDQSTETIHEIEKEFVKLNQKDSNNTPKDFAIRVKTHPGVLAITRNSILKNASIIHGSFADKLIQSTKLKITSKSLKDSWVSFQGFISKYESHFKEINKGVKMHGNVEILEELLRTQKTFQAINFDVDGILNFIKKANQKDLLENWTIVIKSDGSVNNEYVNKILPFDKKFKLIKRSGPESSKSKFYDRLLHENVFSVSGASSNIITGGVDMSFTLSDEEVESITATYKQKNGSSKNPPEKEFREKINPSEGLLVIYMMSTEDVFREGELKEKVVRENIDVNIPLIGVALGIPPLPDNLGGDYLVQSVINDLNSVVDEYENDEYENDDFVTDDE